MDEYITKMSKMKFARVCVEVRGDFKFPNLIMVDLETRIDVVKAIYKWRPKTCSKCVKFGHNLAKCPISSNARGGEARLDVGGRRWQPTILRQQENR